MCDNILSASCSVSSINNKKAVDRIAAYVGTNEEVTSFPEEGKIVLFKRVKNKWQRIFEKKYSFSENATDMSTLRKKIQEMVDSMPGCKTLLAKNLTGIPYYIFEKADYNIWEIEGRPEIFLDSIYQNELNLSNTSPKKEAQTPELKEENPGEFFLSLKEVQKSNSGLTSKQILLPFIKEGNFYSLKVECFHVPPWIMMEIESSQCLEMNISKKDKTLLLEISKKVCGT